MWTRVFDAYPVLAKTAAFLGVTGKLEVEHDVVHLVADSPELPPSRDFR